MSKIMEKVKKHSYKYANEKFNELKNTFMEMGVIKSEFDIEKLTIKKEGNFIAHNYHFLIRQYSLAMSELRRLTLDKEEKEREIEELKKIEADNGHYPKKMDDGKYTDIEIKRRENEIDTIDLSIVNKAHSCDYMEKCRKVLIKINGDKEPTNEDWQKEEPEYIKWFLRREMYYDHVSRQTGIRVGVLNNIDLLEEKPLLNKDYKRIIEKKVDLKEFEEETIRQKQLDIREPNCIE